MAASARIRRLAAACIPLAGLAAAPAHSAVEEIVVTSGLRREAALTDTAASVAVLDAAAIRSSAVQHVEDLLPLVPNLQWSGEGSRARYLQVRGVGELEQYEGAPNAAVGFLVDDIDFSGLGGVATTFDLERFEVLRGPQGARYGASALGGLVYARTAAPSAEPELRAEAQSGSDGLWSIGAVAGGPVAGSDGRLAWRAVAHRHESDGERYNATLGRDDTNGHDERTLRGRLRWLPGADWTVDLVGLQVDLDNGYDAWTIDGSRRTLSDEPGRDTQDSRALALRAEGPLAGGWSLTSITTWADTDVVFGYDADWGSAASWAPDVYAFTQESRRDRRTASQELRLASPAGAGRPAAVLGLYAQRLDEDVTVEDLGLLDIDDASCGAGDPDGTCAPFAVDRLLDSDFRAETAAVFAQADWPLGEATRLTTALRLERRSARYRDVALDRIGDTTAGVAFSPVDRLWGGELSLTRELAAGGQLYARVARGFRASGFNPGLARFEPDEDQVRYADERLTAWEAGWRGGAASWRAGLHGFWQRRGDMQVKVPLQYREGDPATFVFLTDNAESAHAGGVEAEYTRLLAPDWRLEVAAAWLATAIDRFDAAEGTGLRIEGHEFPHAPRVSYAASLVRDAGEGWFGRLDVTGRGSWWYDYDASTGDDRKEPAAVLLALRAGWRWRHVEAEAWARNLLDEEYGTRGFWFGNEPPAFEPRRYVRAGDPRQVGLRLSWRFAADRAP